MVVQGGDSQSATLGSSMNVAALHQDKASTKKLSAELGAAIKTIVNEEVQAQCAAPSEASAGSHRESPRVSTASGSSAVTAAQRTCTAHELAVSYMFRPSMCRYFGNKPPAKLKGLCQQLGGSANKNAQSVPNFVMTKGGHLDVGQFSGHTPNTTAWTFMNLIMCKGTCHKVRATAKIPAPECQCVDGVQTSWYSYAGYRVPALDVIAVIMYVMNTVGYGCLMVPPLGKTMLRAVSLCIDCG